MRVTVRVSWLTRNQVPEPLVPRPGPGTVQHMPVPADTLLDAASDPVLYGRLLRAGESTPAPASPTSEATSAGPAGPCARTDPGRSEAAELVGPVTHETCVELAAEGPHMVVALQLAAARFSDLAASPDEHRIATILDATQPDLRHGPAGDVYVVGYQQRWTNGRQEVLIRYVPGTEQTQDTIAETLPACWCDPCRPCRLHIGPLLLEHHTGSPTRVSVEQAVTSTRALTAAWSNAQRANIRLELHGHGRGVLLRPATAPTDQPTDGAPPAPDECSRVRG